MGVQEHFKSRGILCVVFLVSLLSACVWGRFDYDTLTIGDSTHAGGAPYFHALMDTGGYSDKIYYGLSPEHNYPYHELLSGEWGAALYYDNIDTEQIDPDLPYRRAMWLTKEFEVPAWFTGTDFEISGSCKSWESAGNPAPLKDMGRSFIANNEVEIRIDYEVVDLEYRDPNVWDPNDYLCRSPLGFLEPDAADPNLLRSAYVYSDRYIFLQTYTIENISDETLMNLAFYQMLHSHGANEWGPYVSSTYLPIGYEDPLAEYVPYNPVHCIADSNTVGNFRFDITQWNDETTHTGQCNHKDWVGFSCTEAPDWIDNDVYRENHGTLKPREGTHLNIESRALNGADHILEDEAAGAMGWDLGSLDPNQTVKRTVAFMFCYGGKEPVRHGLYVIKSDDAGDCFDSTDPDATITYTITYGNAGPNAVTEPNVILIDYLPAEADWTSVQPSGSGEYHFITNTVTWEIRTLYVNDWGQETVTFKVTGAKGGGELVGKAVLKNEFNLAQYTRRTPVCPIDIGGIAYVDKFAPGVRDGSSWEDAFHNPQEAIAYINSGYSVEEIWIADGTYKPGIEDSDTFAIPDGIEVYGGFAGWSNPTETKESRNWRKNRTVLSGRILSFPDGYDGEEVYRNNTVVTMGEGSLLDGVTVEEGTWGVDGADVSFELLNCLIMSNQERGISCENGNLTIQWCEVKDNGYYGILHRGSNYLLAVVNCKIHGNQRDGVYTDQSISTIFNSLVYQNGSGSDYYNTYYGINLINPRADTTIRNNTIVHNVNEGIRRTGSNTLTVKNNIIYYNNDGGGQLVNITPDWCCVQGWMGGGTNNKTDNPQFAYDQPPYGFYHIKYESPCRNAGHNTGVGQDETDMDDEPRIADDGYSIVDIGADEVDCINTFNQNDWTYDGIINLEDFAILSSEWLSCQQGTYPQSDLNQDYCVDLGDLILFSEEVYDNWLWRACWKENYMAVYSMMGGGSGEGMLALSSAEGMMSMQPVLSSVEGMMESTYKSEPIEETTIEQQILDLEEVIEFLEKIWMEDPYIQQEIEEEDWKEFMDSVYNSLLELKT